MLKLFRQKNVAKFVLWMIVILIMPAFVLWGTGSLSSSKNKGPKYAGLVNNKKISFEEFFENLNGIRCQIVMNLFNQEKAMAAILRNKPLMVKLAWDRVIMLKEAAKYKITVTDKEVIKYVESHPVFTRNGIFDSRIYQHFLRYTLGLDARTFEEIVRENIKVKKLNDMITRDIEIKDSDVEVEFKKDNGKFRISYLLIDPKEFAGAINIPDDKIKTYYEENRGDFLIPPKEGEPKSAARLASFDEAKDGIKSLLTDIEARIMAMKEAVAIHDRIASVMEKDNAGFEAAVTSLGYKTNESALFGKSDYLEGIGEAATLTAEAAKLDNNTISPAVETRKGILIFRVLESQNIDEEKFKKDKEEYQRKAAESKRNTFLEDWLRRLEEKSTFNIRPEDYDKYFR